MKNLRLLSVVLKKNRNLRKKTMRIRIAADDVAVAAVGAVVVAAVANLAAMLRVNHAANVRNRLHVGQLVISMTNRTMSFWKTMRT